MLDENLKVFLQSKLSNTLYAEFDSKKFLILSFENESKIFSFEEGQIYKFQNEQFTPFSLNEFKNELKTSLEKISAELNHLQNILENKENNVLKGKSSQNFFRKSFILKQKINKNLKFLTQLNEALNLLSSEEESLKKSLKFIIFSANTLQKHAKEILYRLDSLYTLIASLKSEKTNKNIYILSVISTIILPLNLIVGFFGMNTGGLFLAQNPYGTSIITAFIILIFVAGIWYYKRKTSQSEELILFEEKKSKKTRI